MPRTGRMETVRHRPKGVVSGSTRESHYRARKEMRMKLRTLVVSFAILVLTAGIVYAADRFSVRAGEYDPGNTLLVQAQWLDRIGCPTGAAYKEPARKPANASRRNRNPRMP